MSFCRFETSAQLLAGRGDRFKYTAAQFDSATDRGAPTSMETCGGLHLRASLPDCNSYRRLCVAGAKSSCPGTATSCFRGTRTLPRPHIKKSSNVYGTLSPRLGLLSGLFPICG
jgi:hypothetical protein